MPLVNSDACSSLQASRKALWNRWRDPWWPVKTRKIRFNATSVNLMKHAPRKVKTWETCGKNLRGFPFGQWSTFIVGKHHICLSLQEGSMRHKLKILAVNPTVLPLKFANKKQATILSNQNDPILLRGVSSTKKFLCNHTIIGSIPTCQGYYHSRKSNDSCANGSRCQNLGCYPPVDIDPAK